MVRGDVRRGLRRSCHDALERTPGKACLALGMLMTAAASVAAQPSYPSRPVRLVVPYPPGGATDFTAREISQRLTEAFGQQFVVDNRSGAGGNDRTRGSSTKAAPDGYTLVVGTFGGLVSGPALMGDRLPYDPVKDLVADRARGLHAVGAAHRIRRSRRKR